MKYKNTIDKLTIILPEILARVVARKMIELSDNDDAKKTLETNNFMTMLLTGKAIPKGLADDADYQLASEIAEAITVLSKIE